MTPTILARRMQTMLTISMVGAFGGCTNIQDDRARTRTEGAVAGAAAGAAGGGLAGAAYGDSVAKKKEGYAQQESTLDAQLAGLKNQIASRQAYNEKLAASIAMKEKQLQTILASDRSAGPTVQEFDLRTSINSQLGQINRDSRSWQETIAAHKAVLEKAGGDPRSTELQSEIDRLSEKQSELLRQRARLISINDQLQQ